MRKIIATMFISLDGVVDGLDRWHFSYFNDEMGVAVFGEGKSPIPLTLISCETLKAGVLDLVYGPAEDRRRHL